MATEVKQPWVQALLDWYYANGRELPWRGVGDPYRIWVSEVMSQQTRIEAMKPYYENWMQQFPTMEALAAADEDTVVKAWQGLGYYSRARNLRLGVKEVVEKYNGVVPRDRKAVESLKGVGNYTAGAILSLAYGLPEPAIDGNVLRVYARLYCVTEDIMRTAGKKQIAALVDSTLPSDCAGDFNQALMDFGSAVCIPKAPRCEGCPLRRWCEADAKNMAAELPVRIVKTKVPTIPLTVGLIVDGEGRYLLHRRPDTGLLRSMWEFATAAGEEQAAPKAKKVKAIDLPPAAVAAKARAQAEDADQKVSGSLERPTPDALAKSLGLLVDWQDAPITTLRHVFSHRIWDMKVYKGTLNGYKAVRPVVGGLVAQDDSWRWVSPDDFTELPWAGPHGKLTVYCK